ncbi:HNH endonuclease signature motif containing protein [Agarivorans aestuarii]|uniref:HNH endonuclease signature motif containing protein n=1 Tax=Agarivorans aestuarii TaxID=1563703 RepID=A0ABU7G5S7_9ALTE|nr:HNH endonuclease signature motif containing protein [Agarivorans aestuarii]MEE1674757.1 HNH endonuclease signature motif containing protein [Agarivorans aestuarii]
MYSVSFRVNDKVHRKSYKTESGAMRAIRKWFQQHPESMHTLVMLYGPDQEPISYTQACDLPEVTSKVSDFYRSQAWLDLRYKALNQYGNSCACCGRGLENGATLHVDHIKPRSRYPELELKLDNLQVLCDQCNIGKSNKSEKQWR